MRDGSGNMALLAGNPIPYGTRPASSALQNSTLADMAAEITDSLSRSGKGAMLANINMGGFGLDNVGAIAGYSNTAAIAAAYLSQASAAATYLSLAAAAATYQTISGMSAYQPVSGMSSYLTTAVAAATYLSQANAASTYLTQANAASTYAALSGAAFGGSISVTGNITLTGTLTPQGGAALGKITASASSPSGGNNDDLWFQY